MLMDLICNHYRDQLGNSGKDQIRMECFPILRFAPGNTETVLEMVYGFSTFTRIL